MKERIPEARLEPLQIPVAAPADGKFPSSFALPDLSLPANLEFVTEAFFTAIVGRLFDPSVLMSAFADCKVENNKHGGRRRREFQTNIPMREQVERFIEFLQSQKGKKLN